MGPPARVAANNCRRRVPRLMRLPSGLYRENAEAYCITCHSCSGHNRYRAMSNTLNSEIDPTQPTVYQIRIKGHLDRQWAEWFGGLTITLEDNGDTLFTGTVTDQAALHGLLKKVRDLGTPLISVICVKPGQGDVSDVEP